MLSLIGAKALETLQGVDLFSQQRLFGDTYNVNEVVHDDGDYQVGNADATRLSRFMIKGDWKLTLVADYTRLWLHDPATSVPAVQLYNLTNDPDETTNLAASEAARVAAMVATLEDWWTSTRQVYHYGHEFNETEPLLHGMPPDVINSSLPATTSVSSGGVSDSGTVDGGRPRSSRSRLKTGSGTSCGPS